MPLNFTPPFDIPDVPLTSPYPPLLNSSSPWASTYADLKALYHCPHTCAVTTRTSLLDKGFSHNKDHHQHCFIDINQPEHIISHSEPAQLVGPKTTAPTAPPTGKSSQITSLNTYGYSPFPLAQYIAWAVEILKEAHSSSLAPSASSSPPSLPCKPFIFSVTGTPLEVAECYAVISSAQQQLHLKGFKSTASFLMEINLSCPNIADKPPPGYSMPALEEYLSAIQQAKSSSQLSIFLPVTVGIKTPPYTYKTQFTDLISVLLSFGTECPIEFITAVNTLGSSLITVPSFASSFDSDEHKSALMVGETGGIGGLAGKAIHPLALGNVSTLGRLLREHESLKGIQIIGTGGVSDHAGYQRMRTVCASAVGIGTALGVDGIEVFQKILHDQSCYPGGSRSLTASHSHEVMDVHV